MNEFFLYHLNSVCFLHSERIYFIFQLYWDRIKSIFVHCHLCPWFMFHKNNVCEQTYWFFCRKFYELESVVDLHDLPENNHSIFQLDSKWHLYSIKGLQIQYHLSLKYCEFDLCSEVVRCLFCRSFIWAVITFFEQATISEICIFI